MKIEKEFIPYEQALNLKELGFDEPCFATYNSDKKVNRNPSHNMEDLPIEGQPYYWNNSKIYKSCITAPLYQQAFKWLWNKTGKYIIPIQKDDKEWLAIGIIYKTYEEAELECLKKLIEIIKKK